MRWQNLKNTMTVTLMRSPFRRLMGKHTLLITYPRKPGGELHTTAVPYLTEGQSLLIFSHYRCLWWKHLNGGVPVTIYMRGHTLHATGDICRDHATIVAKLPQFLQQFSHYRRMLSVHLQADGSPTDKAEFERIANELILVCINELSL